MIGTTTYADAEIPASEFEDENFYNFVMENYDSNGDGVLMESEAQAVESMNVYHSDIGSLKGIEQFTKVNTLVIGSNNKIEELAHIDLLPELKELYLSYCSALSDISIIMNISGLEVFVMHSCYSIMDFSPIDSCANLEKFTAADIPQLTDLSILDGKNIKHLSLSESNNIEDYSVLNQFSLESLVISGDNLTDISFLQNCSQMKELSIFECNNIIDYSYLKYCADTPNISISNTNMKDLSVLSYMTNLYSVSLINGDFTDITPLLASAEKIDNITLNNSNVTDISCLTEFSNLRVLSIEYLNINELPDLTSLSTLQYVYATGTGITEEEASAKLPAGVTFINENVTTENDSYTEEETNLLNMKTLTSILDEDIQAEGKFDEKTYLEGERIYDTSLHQNIITDLYDRIEDVREIRVYDIALYKDITENETTVKVKVQPDDSVKVSIKVRDIISGAGCKVYRQEDDGSLTEIDCYLNGQTVHFYSEHFSIFTLVITKFLGEDIGNDAEDTIVIYDGNGDSVGGDETTRRFDTSVDNNSLEDETTGNYYDVSEEDSGYGKNKIDSITNTVEHSDGQKDKERESTEQDERVREKESKKDSTKAKIIIVSIVVGIVVLDIAAYEIYAWDRKTKIDVNEASSVDE